MTFTYDTATDIGKIRLELGDEISGNGVKPTGANLTDEELQVWLTREGSVMRATAAACEMLSRAWSRMASTSVGSRSEQLQSVAAQYAARAQTLRAQHGGGTSGVSFVSFNRTDGYATASGGTLDDGSEYA